MGGRLVLLKSVLSSLPIYFLSFFKAPAGIREFNLSLLGKWSWRLLVDKEGLWFKVLVAKYGMTDGRITRRGRQASLWWQDLCDVRDGVDLSIGKWFENNISRKVGNGEGTLFWKDSWLEGGSLSTRFNRLFELALDKNIMVADMYRQEVGTLGVDVMDKWTWRPEPSIGYSVRSAYHLLTHLVPVTMATHNDVIWNKVVPLKIQSCAQEDVESPKLLITWLFAHKELSVEALVEKVKITSWWWLDIRKHDFDCASNSWQSNPLVLIATFVTASIQPCRV
ncbi:hypothetical protein TSUD_30620 [Trifolium subterraneum]|uniref:Reverse transcriptase zinc-binding domain-containing protein n=1 Tax=Trifolium subterraneum TaxID=3900 RepID=A0A2Z6P4B0_TRISU|nr:hypothetical protein TSUD_30620 [Trifolium subterraneum]